MNRAGNRISHDFTGKTVLVTGASAGCGLGLARGFARHGASLVMVARDKQKLEEAALRIAQDGGDVRYFTCDVTDEKAIGEVIAALSRLDVLVNNAGTNIPEPFLDVSIANLRTLLRLNLRATYVVTRQAIAKMRESEDRPTTGGAIINISSQMGHIGSPERAAYCTSKHGIEGLTKALAIELAPENIRVNSVAPTFVDTPLIRQIVDTPEKKQALFDRIPLGRLATEEDVANAALYLASAEAGMVTGMSLRVDGGWCAF